MASLMTLNINFDVDKHGAWPLRRDAVVRAIREAGPDIVALQAVQRDPTGDQAVELARLLPGYSHVTFEPAGSRGDGTDYGMAVLSRTAPSDVRLFRLSYTPSEDPFRRLVLHTVYPMEPAPLHVFNAHLSWVPAVASQNVHELTGYVGSASGFGVILGDFNTLPESAALDPLRQTGWTDGWPEVNANDPGYTFEAPTPDRRIDYVWVNALLRPRLGEMKLVRAAGPPPGIDLSDHFGLGVTLLLDQGTTDRRTGRATD